MFPSGSRSASISTLPAPSYSTSSHTHLQYQSFHQALTFWSKRIPWGVSGTRPTRQALQGCFPRCSTWTSECATYRPRPNFSAGMANLASVPVTTDSDGFDSLHSTAVPPHHEGRRPLPPPQLHLHSSARSRPRTYATPIEVQRLRLERQRDVL